MSVKFIIGVDASLRNVGVTVMDNTGMRIDSFNIVTANGTPDHASVDKIVGEFFEKLEDYFTIEMIKNKAVAFFFEDIVFGRVGKATARSEVAGVLKWGIRAEGFNIFGVPPKMANSFLDGRFGLKTTRRSSKVQKAHTISVLNRHCNFYTKNDNIADSYVMALVGYAYLIEKQRLGVRALCRVKF